MRDLTRPVVRSVAFVARLTAPAGVFAKVTSLTPEQMARFTPQNPYDRFQIGRALV